MCLCMSVKDKDRQTCVQTDRNVFIPNVMCFEAGFHLTTASKLTQDNNVYYSKATFILLVFFSVGVDHRELFELSCNVGLCMSS